MHFPKGGGGGEGGVGQWSERHGSTLGGAKFFETSFPHFKTSCTQIVVIFRQQYKTFDPNNFTLSSMFSFQNAWPIKRKAVYNLLLFHIFTDFLDRIGTQLAYFLNLLI